jgi:hypothetical protein
LVLSAEVHAASLCTTETVGRGFSTTNWLRSLCPALSSRLGRYSLHGSVPKLGARRARLAGGGASPSRESAVVVLRTGGETARLPQVLPRRWVVERTFSRGWGRRGGSGQGLRAIAGDRGGHDLVGHEPHHMLRRLVSARSAEMPYEGLMKAALRPFAKQFLERLSEKGYE